MFLIGGSDARRPHRGAPSTDHDRWESSPVISSSRARLFLSFLTFRVPTGLDDAATLLYVYLTYAVLGLLYSLVNIPYGSLASAMTQSVRQRAKLISGRTLGAAAGSVLISYIIAPQISALRAQKNTLPSDVYLDQAQSIFTNITLLFILLGSIAFGLTFLWCHETVVRRSPRVTVKETFATLRQNRPLAILCGASFFYLVGFYTVTGATLYYAPTFSATRDSRSGRAAEHRRPDLRHAVRAELIDTVRQEDPVQYRHPDVIGGSASTSPRTAWSGSRCSAWASRASGSR